MNKQDLIDLQELIDAAQNAIDKAVEAAREMAADSDDDEEVEAFEALLDELDTQLPAVGDHFPEETKP